MEISAIEMAKVYGFTGAAILAAGVLGTGFIVAFLDPQLENFKKIVTI